MTTTYRFKFGFTVSGIASAPASAPVCTVVDTSNNVLASAQATTALSNLIGAYLYSYTGADGLDLIGKVHTDDASVDQQDLFSYTAQELHDIRGRLPAALTVNGNIKSSVLEWISTLFTEGATGRFATALQTMFNVASPVMTAQNVNQTGDVFARIGAPAGASVSADIAAIETTVAVSSTEAANVSSGRLSVTAGYTFRQTILSDSTDDLSAATKLWVAVKAGDNLSDALSDIFVEKTGGLTVLRGAVYVTVAHGSLTVSGSVGAWEIAIYISEIATGSLFGIGSDLRVAGLKYTKAVTGDDLPAWDGTAVIVDGIVRAAG